MTEWINIEEDIPLKDPMYDIIVTYKYIDERRYYL